LKHTCSCTCTAE